MSITVSAKFSYMRSTAGDEALGLIEITGDGIHEVVALTEGQGKFAFEVEHRGEHRLERYQIMVVVGRVLLYLGGTREPEFTIQVALRSATLH